MAATLTLRSTTGQTLATHHLDTPLTLRAQPRVQYLLADDNGLAAKATATRAGNDLLVAIDGETALRLEDYFLADDTGLANPLLGMNASGQYVAYPIADAVLPLEHTLAAEIATSGGAPPIAALAAVGGIALTGAAIADSRKENTTIIPDAKQPQTPYDPNQPLPPADNGNSAPPPAGGGNPPPPPANPPPIPAPNNPPTGDVQISGTPEVGKTLTASHSLKDDDGLGQITYRWFANGTEVGTGSTYTLSAADKGKAITVKAEYTDGKGNPESVTSAATTPVTDPVVPPANNHAPTAPVLSREANKSFWVNAGQSGAAIGKVSATDADGDALTYHVSDNRFEIAGDTLKLKDGQHIDYANEKRILLTVTARDVHGAEASRDIAVQVKDTGAYQSDNPHAFALPALADGDEVIVPAAPQLVREANGSVVITPDAHADTLHLRYQDASGKTHLVDLAWERFEQRWYSSDPAIRPVPFERTVTLAADQLKPGSKVFASNAAKGIYADDTGTLDGTAEAPAALEAYLYAANRGAVTEGHAAHYLVRLNKAATQDLTFHITLTHKDSDASDAALATQSVTIRAGERHARFAVALADDSHAEGTETYKVSIASASGNVHIPASRASLSGEIRDNDQPRPTFDHDNDNLYYTPASGASAMTLSYHDIDYGAVTLNTWRDAGGTWHISQLNPDKRASVPTIDAQSGKVSIPFAITSGLGSISAHHDHLADSANGRNTAIPEYQGWQTDWRDTFSDSLDTTGWTRYGWGWQAPEFGGMGRYYQSNGFTADGALHIRSQYHDGEWSSAGISSGETFSAVGGRWEIRARFPDAKGIGYAFLLWPKSEQWPPEVDFAEGRVRDPQIMATYHWGTVDNHMQDNRYLQNEDLTDWHTYGAIVDPVNNTITYTFDGKPWFTLKDVPVTSEALWIGFQTGAQDPNGSFAQYESIDNAIPGIDTPAVADIEIDWVAHYRPSASPKTLTLPESVQQGTPDADRFTLDNHGVKTLTGFNVREGDLLQLDSASFPALAKGTLAENAFTVGSTASSAEHRILYNPDNGELSYDPDGNGAASATTIAHLDPGLALEAQHIHIL